MQNVYIVEAYNYSDRTKLGAFKSIDGAKQCLLDTIKNPPKYAFSEKHLSLSPDTLRIDVSDDTGEPCECSGAIITIIPLLD